MQTPTWFVKQCNCQGKTMIGSEKKVEKMKKLGRLSTKKQLPDSDDDVIG